MRAPAVAAAGLGLLGLAVEGQVTSVVLNFPATSTATDSCINFAEMMVWNTDGQLVSVSGSNGVTVGGTAGAFGGTLGGGYDFLFGPATTGNGNNVYGTFGASYYHSPCTPGRTDFYQTAFPSQSVAQVTFVNRCEGGAGGIAGRANNLQLQARSGATVVATVPLASAACVTTRNFGAPFNAPVLPDPSSPAQLLNRLNWARYVRLTATTANFIHFREIFVLDDTLTNVVRNKTCTTSSAAYDDASVCNRANDHIIDFDASGGNLFHSGSSATGHWIEFDLGALYNVRRVVIFNRYLSQFYGGSASGGCCATRMNGVAVSLRNWYGEVIQTFTMGGGAPVYSFPVTLPASTPSLSNSPTAVPPTATSSPSATLSTGAAPSASPTLSQVPVPIPIAVQVRSTGGHQLGLNELIVMTPTGRILGPLTVTSTASWHGEGVPANVADFCLNTWNATACPNYATGSLTEPATVRASWPFPEPVASVLFFNRQPAAVGNRLLQQQQVFVELVNHDGTIAGSQQITNANSVTQYTFAPWAAPVPVDAATQTPDNVAAWPRYVRIDALSNQFLHFRELWVLDGNNVNVALRKPVTGSLQYMQDADPYLNPNGNDGVLTPFDAGGGNLVHAVAFGGFWEVDLGGAIDVRRVVLFNRGGSNAIRMNLANLTFFNANRAPVAQITLNALNVQVYDVTRFAPTGTPTNTPTASSTASSSGTNTGTPSASATETGTPSSSVTQTSTVSSGAEPSTTSSASWSSSNTGTPTSSPSNTPSSSATATGTPSITGSPLSSLPGRVRIDISNAACLNFIEVLAITPDGRIVSAAAAGAVATMSSALANMNASNGNDLRVDMWGNANGQGLLAHSQCNGQAQSSIYGEFWEVTFYPEPLAQVLFINRMDCCTNRVIAGSATMTVFSQTGVQLARTDLLNDAITTITMAPYTAPVSPDPTAPGQGDFYSRENSARYVRVSTAGGTSFSFRELMVLDATYNNVARGKTAVVYSAGTGSATATHGTDMTFDYSNNTAASNAVRLNGTGMVATDRPSYSLDLGGLYAPAELTRVILWNNRYALPGATVRVELLNFFGVQIGNYAPATNSYAPTWNLTAPGAIFPPTPTNTPTSSPSNTASASASATASSTASLPADTTPSQTSTASITATPSNSPMSMHPHSLRIEQQGTADNCMNFLEVLVFNAEGKLISTQEAGGVSTISSAYSANSGADKGNDGCLNVNQATTDVSGGCQLAHTNCVAGELNWWRLTFAPQLPLFPTGLPQRLGSVYFVNRPGVNGARISNNRGNVSLYRIDGALIDRRPLAPQTVTYWGVNPIVLPSVPLDDAPEASKQNLVRFITIRAAPGADGFLHFKEFMAFDEQGYNVALNKPTSGTPPYVGDASTYTLAEGNNGIVDTNQVDLDLYHASVAGGFWRVDLQGMHDIRRIIYFNRGDGSQGRGNNQVVTFSNFYGAPVGTLTLTGELMSLRNVTLFPPSTSSTTTPSPSGTGSPSETPSASGTSAETTTPTASETPTPTASISGGVTPSITSSASNTATNTPSTSFSSSITPSETPSSTVTPSVSPSVLSTLPGSVEITIGYNFCLNFYELMAISPEGRVVSASVAGGVASMSTTYAPANNASAGIDLHMDPQGIFGSTVVHAACAASDWWRVNFYPTEIAQIVISNRADGGNNVRFVGGGAQVAVRRQTGPTTFTATLTAGWVQDYTVAPYAAVTVPDPTAADQTSEEARVARVRSLRITGPVGGSLYFRELMALDATVTNVARGKTATATGGSGEATAPEGVDAVFNYDGSGTASGVRINATAGVAPSWSLDLGGLYDIQRVLFFANRFNRVPIGTVLELLNGNGAVIGSYPLTAPHYVQTIDTTAGRFAPTPSNSPTASGTATPTATLSGGASVSASPSNEPTPSETTTPASVHPAEIRVTASNQYVNLVEVWAFNTAGKLITTPAEGAVASQTTTLGSFAASNGIDGCVSMAQAGGLVNGCALAQTDLTISREQWRVAFPPQPLGAVYFFNRQDGGFGTRVRAGTTNMTLHRTDGTQIGATPLHIGAVTTWQVAPITLPVVPLDDATDAAKSTLIRYINIQAAAGAWLHFKEVMAFDEQGYNVALNKPVTGTPPYVGDPSAYGLSEANNGIIDNDQVDLDMYHASVVTGFWRVDLQGMHDIRRLMVVNRGPLNSGNMPRLNNSVVTFLNYYGVPVGTLTLTGDYIQAWPVTRFPPTPTRTGTPSPSQTASNTGTPSSSGTETGTPSPSGTGTQTSTASISFGTTPSITASVTGSPSNSPTGSITASGTSSASLTATSTASITQSPFSVHPSRVEITIGFGFCLNFHELVAITPEGRFVSLAAAGGVASMSTTYNADSGAGRAIDGFMDPYATAGSNSAVAHAACAASDWWRVNFYPTPIARLIVVNRGDGGNNNRFVGGGAQLTVYRQTGTQAYTQPLTGGIVQEYTLAPYAAVTSPDPTAADQVDETNRQMKVRFVRVTAPIGEPLAVREIFVLDTNYVNVARGKGVTLSVPTEAGPASHVTDGVLDFDNANLATGNGVYVSPLASLTAGVPTTVEVDLGGLYDVQQIHVFFNRFQLGNLPVAVTVGNFVGDTVGNYNLPAGVRVSTTVVFNTTYPPAPTPSSTQTPTETRTPSRSSSNTPTNTASPTASVSVSATPSESFYERTPSETGTATGTGTPTPTASFTAASTGSPTRSNTASISASRTGTASSSATRSCTASVSVTATITASSSQTRTGTSSSSSTRSATASVSASRTASRTGTPTRSETASGTSTDSSSVSATATGTGSSSPSSTGTGSASNTETGTPSSSASETGTPSASSTETGTGSSSASVTAAATQSSTATRSMAPSGTATKTAIPLPSRSRTATRTRSRTASRTKTRTRTRTRTPSKKKKMLLE